MKALYPSLETSLYVIADKLNTGLPYNTLTLPSERVVWACDWPTYIGVGAQSTLGGTTFLPEKYVWKINKMPEFYMILSRKINKIP